MKHLLTFNLKSMRALIDWARQYLIDIDVWITKNITEYNVKEILKTKWRLRQYKKFSL